MLENKFKDKVSVLMSVHNDEKNIENAIKSIQSQTFQNFEFLIIDDGSTDNTLNIIKQFQKSDNRINLIINKKNIGLTKSLNKLILKSSTNLLFRQDSDDTSDSIRFEKQLKFLIENNLDWCTTKAINIVNQKELHRISFYFPKKMILKYKNPFIHGSLLIKKSVMNALGNYDEDFYYAQDYKLYSDLFKNKYKMKILNETLYHLNTSDNISSNYYVQQKYYANCVKKNLKPNKNYENLYK